jgi:hypothetical protein
MSAPIREAGRLAGGARAGTVTRQGGSGALRLPCVAPRLPSSEEPVVGAWSDAQEAFKGGKVDEAVAKAKIVKDKTAEIMTKLGMQVPQAAAKS